MKENKDLLLHTCCAPCFTAVFETLSPKNNITIFWYNPNIEPEKEHQKRFESLEAYLEKSKINSRVIYDYDYKKENKKWHNFVAGLESEPEGGERCHKCFEFRLKQLLKTAKNSDATTTLTVSPHKDSRAINKIGRIMATLFGRNFLIYDFKKNDGYRRSIELSKEFGLYRQSYCGCLFSKKPAISS